MIRLDVTTSGDRLDKFIADNSEHSRSSIANVIEEGNVFVNGKIETKKYKVKIGDVVEYEEPCCKELFATPENIPIDIIYEDDDLLVVNKPKGMVVHPAPGNRNGTLVNALMYHCVNNLSTVNGDVRPGIVHRIDKNTSGLLIVAKNDISHAKLASQIQVHSFKREYEAVVYGVLKNDKGTITTPIGRHKNFRTKMSVNGINPKMATTHYEVIKRYNNFTHVKLTLETGRTHQIRVHMAYIGHPVAGDDVYGPKKVIESLNGQCLHARVIGFVHPTTNQYVEFTSPLPEYFQEFLKKCERI